MGSSSDWETMQGAADVLDSLGIAHEVRVVSAHRTPDLLFEYAATARERGLKAIIAGAGGAAHLPGMTAAKTSVPVLGVPVQSKALNGIDSLLSIAQMPSGIPVATFAIGAAGAKNAALFAAAILANESIDIRTALDAFRRAQTAAVLAKLAERKQRHDLEIRHFQQIERWRDRLLSEPSGLDELLQEYPHADRAALAKLLEKAEKERREQRSPVGARELFAFLRQLLG